MKISISFKKVAIMFRYDYFRLKIFNYYPKFGVLSIDVSIRKLFPIKFNWKIVVFIVEF